MIFRFYREGRLYIGYHHDFSSRSYWMVPNLVNPYE